MELGMDDFVEKPIDFERLIVRLTTLYKRHGL